LPARSRLLPGEHQHLQRQTFVQNLSKRKEARQTEARERVAVTDLIPTPVTDLDRRVNDAYRRALRRGKLQYVWEDPNDEYLGLLITDDRPPHAVAVAVSPDGWAMICAIGADVPWREGEPP
jgi:hypothetical protein